MSWGDEDAGPFLFGLAIVLLIVCVVAICILAPAIAAYGYMHGWWAP